MSFTTGAALLDAVVLAVVSREEEGTYEPFNGRNRRYYKITPLGRQQLAGYKAEWKVYAANIDHIFGEDAK